MLDVLLVDDIFDTGHTLLGVMRQIRDQGVTILIIEHVMHAIELSLEGRNDEKANRIRKEVPKAELVLDDLDLVADVDHRHRQAMGAG